MYYISNMCLNNLPNNLMREYFIIEAVGNICYRQFFVTFVFYNSTLQNRAKYTSFISI